MPEGDSLVRVAHRLRPVLEGRVLTHADLRVPRHATADLTGWTVAEVLPRAKYLLMRLTPPTARPGARPLTLISHLKMEGRWLVSALDARWGAPAWQVRAVLETAEHRVLGAQLGLLTLVPTADEATVLGHLGPDLLDPTWDDTHRTRAIDHLAAEPERALGLALLSMVGYMHFRIEHAYGHHRYVGTAQDSASAALGEGFPAFFMRSLRGGLCSAWAIEAQRLERRGKRRWSSGNRMLHYALIQGVIGMSLLGWGGFALLGWFLLQSFIAVHLLEAVNYVQHYGLRREESGSGIEALGPQHAWDADGAVSGLLVFNLSRHADHHLRVSKTCDALQALPAAPRLPFSFFLMVFLALFPPLWRRLMDARVPGRQPWSLPEPSETPAGSAVA